MLLCVGLGNPGPDYATTPHNVGRETLFALLTRAGFSEFRSEWKFKALVSDGLLKRHKVVAALPETYMNRSGEAVSAVAQYYKVAPKDVWVFHDDIDLPAGSVRIDFGAGAAGHHGVESCIEKLGTNEFWRFRIGIAPKAKLAMPLDAYVLKKSALSGDDLDVIGEKVQTLIELALEKGIEEARLASD